MDGSHPALGRLASHAWWLFAACGIALTAMEWRHMSGFFVSEIPYEESAFVVAVESSDSESGLTVTWSEHPALPMALFRLMACDGRGIQGLQSARVMSGVFYFLGFCGTLVFVCWSMRGVRGHSDAFAGLFTLSVFSMPGVLCHACRANSESLTYAACVALLLSSRSLAHRGGPIACGLVTICAVALTWANCYGCVFTAALIIAYALAVLWRPPMNISHVASWTADNKRRGSIAKLCGRPLCRAAGFLGAGVVVAGVMLIPAFQFADRLHTLRGHYWAMPRVHDTYGIPFSFQLRLATELNVIELPYLADCLLGVALVLMALPCVIAKVSFDTLVLLVATAISTVALVVSDFAMGPLIVPHMLGLQLLLGVLALYFAIGDISRPGQVIFVGVMFVATTLPSAIALFAKPIYSDEYITRGAHAIERMKTDCDTVLYAGSRAYIMFHPFRLSDDRTRCRVYCRTGLWPDNFTARSLVPPEIRVTDDDLSRLHGATVLYVQLEAAQSIRIDTSAWDIKKTELIAHPCNAVGNIIIIVLTPKGSQLTQESGSVTMPRF